MVRQTNIRWGGWRALLPLFLLICICSANRARAQVRFYTQYMLDRVAVEIPFEYKDHQILMHGDAGGKKDLTLLFDSGASTPVMDKSLELKGSHLADTTIQESEGTSNVEAIWLDDLRLGPKDNGVAAHNIVTILTDLSQISKAVGCKIDGVIGISFMAGFVVEIDYDKHLVRFHNPNVYNLTQRVPDNQRTFLFALTRTTIKSPTSCMMVEGRLDSKYDYNFLLDTGFGGYVSVAQSAAQEAGMFKADTPRIAATSFSVSHAFQSNKIRAPYLMLGAINLSGRVVQVDYRNNDVYGQNGIVGNRLLQNYRLTLDYRNRKLWLERVTEKEELDDAEKPSLGISVRADGKTIRVEKILPNSPAAHAEMRVGDEIVSVNGQALAELSTAQALNLLATPHGETKLVLMHGVDPNFGSQDGSYTCTLSPSSPLDWKAQ